MALKVTRTAQAACLRALTRSAQHQQPVLAIGSTKTKVNTQTEENIGVRTQVPGVGWRFTRQGRIFDL